MLLKRVLIANRGEIAVRLIKACQKLDVTAIAIYTEEDAGSLHIRVADEAYALSGDRAAGYLDVDQIIEICRRRNIQAVFPGYGFLSENATFAEALTQSSILFIGPAAKTLEEFGLKHRARELAINAAVPVVPGSEMIKTIEDAEESARSLGFPVMVKATAGGGGIGLQVCHHPDELKAAFDMVKSRGNALFKNDGMFIEKFVESGRHAETQIFGNGQGDIVFLGERECSIQRRHQKIIEECPSPFVVQNPELRQKLKEASVMLASAVKYQSVGTVEFLVDDSTGAFYFLEMNTRLQVEHGITELCYDVDLCEMMLLQAEEQLNGRGGLSKTQMQSFQRSAPNGHAIEVRVYAENPAKDFSPSPGLFQHVAFPENEKVRVDTWIQTGTTVSPSFDPLLAKVMAHADTRSDAIAAMGQTLDTTILQGPATNMDFCRQVLVSSRFLAGLTTTNMLSKHFRYQPSAMEFIEPGAYTTVQDYPGRENFPNGVPMSGPMDALSFQVANILVGNPRGTEGFEITLRGPKIKFYASAVIAICGGDFSVTVNNEPVACWSRIIAKENDVLEIGEAATGARGYLAIRGGLPHVARYLESKSTTPSLSWGGFQGRIMRAGDFLFLGSSAAQSTTTTRPYSLPKDMVPLMEENPRIYALPGPWFDQGYITENGQQSLMGGSQYKVSFNSSRVGIRLDGPPPSWSRKDGGEGGSHPSNMVGYGCTVGGVSFTGDSGIILPADAPNQTGFITTHTVARADLWRVAQLKPGAAFHFQSITFEQAMMLEDRTNAYLELVTHCVQESALNCQTIDRRLDWVVQSVPTGEGILYQHNACGEDQLAMTIRQSGDRAVLCVLGNGVFDMAVRARLQQLSNVIQQHTPPGLRKFSVAENASILVYFDPHKISQAKVVNWILELEKDLPPLSVSKQACRIIHLPAVFDGRECQLSIERYMNLQRSKAAYLPDNIDFIRRSNGLKDITEVKNCFFETPMLVNAVGWMMGLPIYIQIDPRRRLNVPKYNPSRTFTAAGSLGIGGNTCSIYPSDSPGGYVLWGATLPGCCWDIYGQKPGFSPERPWLFNSFDQIIFHEVSREEFDESVRLFKAGLYEIRIEVGDFDMAAYHELAESTKEKVRQLREIQDSCTQAEIRREAELYKEWLEEKRVTEEKERQTKEERQRRVNGAKGLIPVLCNMIAAITKIEVTPDQIVEEGAILVKIEAMKMETSVSVPEPPKNGTKSQKFRVHEIMRQTGDRVEVGDTLVLLEKIV
ncbi:urea carboxylase [Cyphellophora europaea CBS 101466]|uniref:Urea carboxylase n=1 Tax=Cyphellophora europaea (strain CBS 101466) TaxID=1220924 RepID=W2S9A4_CYPE1|nr:urea carboxylase [Cyphellophora europaea CBS 101466]ETN44613.1 urea carboxylase [Cyphellophora europaea CBS 101466]